MPLKPCDQNIQAVLAISEKMISLAKQGDADREDSGCGILYGVLLDAGYKIKKMAEQEKQAHIQKGWWQEES